MIRIIAFLFCFTFLTASSSFSQTSLIDSTKFDKIGNKKNGFFIEAMGASSLAGVYYQRSIFIKVKKKVPVQIRIMGGFSPFTFFRFNFSDGVSFPIGLGATFLPTRFKFGVAMMFLNSVFFQPIQVEDHGYTPIKITETTFKLFLQPQLSFEYHFNTKMVGKLTFNPTFMPELTGGKTTYAFMPWAGAAFGYKF